MNPAGDGERLPPSTGGVVDFALAAYAQRAPFYLALALLVFAVGAVVEFAIPAVPPDTWLGELKIVLLELSSVFVDSYVVTAVALGVASRLSGETVSTRRLAGAATERWLAVLAVAMLVQIVIDTTGPLSGFGPLPDHPALLFLTAPVTWLVWGMLSLALPIAALSSERALVAVMLGITRAVTLSLRGPNLLRLCLVAFVTIVPFMLQEIALSLMRGHVARLIFWSSVPLDALTVGAIAALQTAFAIDFARRAADQRSA